MAQVAVRPPRFLGERVPMREQTVQERLQESLPGYTVESSDGGYIAKAEPVKYLKVKDSRTKMIRGGQQFQYDTYVPHELIISPEGEVRREVKRGTFKEDASGKIRKWAVYESEVTDYDKQTRLTYGKRDMKSGRETIRETSSLVGGVYKEKRIIDQDTQEYQKLQRTPEQAKLIREKGFTVRRAEEYAVAGMTKEQRRAYYKLKAQQRTTQLSLEAKAQKIARLETEKFRKELSAESQKYAMNIVAEQEAQRPKTPALFVKTTPEPVSPGPSMDIIAPTPASPTTRTDMTDKPFLIGGKLPPGELQEAPGPKTLMERYTRFQDLLSQRQAKASAKDQAGKTVALGASQFALGVPVGAFQFGKAILPWNLPDTVGSMVNPESYRILGQQFATEPAKTSGELTGSLLAGYGLSRGVQAVKVKLEQLKQPTGESAVGQLAKTRKDVQAKLPTKGERFTGRIEAREMRFAKAKTGKGQIESTVFTAKVIKDPRTGKYIRTPEIGIIRYEIPGDPTRLGTAYTTKTYAYTGKPIRVRPEVQQPLSRPEIVATSKWLPGDVRPVVVKTVRGQPTPYVPDWTGATLRKFRPGEFALSTVYPKPGLQPSQASAVAFNKLSYTKTYSTPLGPVTVRKPPTTGVQTQLPSNKPIVITIVKKPGATLKPLEGSVVTPTSPKVSTGGGSQVVTTIASQKYASSGEVIKGTLKVYPKAQLVGKAEAIPGVDLPDAQPMPKTTLPVKQSYAGIGLVGVLKQLKPQTSLVTPTIQPSPILQEPIIKTEPVTKVNITPESLAKYKDEAIAIPDSAQVPVIQPITISQPTLRTETRTELRTETILRTEPLLEQVTETTPVTRTGIPLEAVPPLEPPPKLKWVRPPEEEREKRGKYKVQVRQKGIFKDLALTESPEEAFRIGAQKVLGDSTASLRVRPIGSTESVSQVGRSILSKKLFRESKKEPGVFIERRQFRLDAPKEKKEITFKGLLALKSKRRSIFT